MSMVGGRPINARNVERLIGDTLAPVAVWPTLTVAERGEKATFFMTTEPPRRAQDHDHQQGDERAAPSEALRRPPPRTCTRRACRRGRSRAGRAVRSPS